MKKYMRKTMSICLIAALMTMYLTGCKSEGQSPDDSKDANTPVPTNTVTPTQSLKEDEAPAEDITEAELLPGFEGWERNEAVKALNKVLRMEAELQLVNSKDKVDEVELTGYRLDKISKLKDYEFEKDMTPDKYAVVDMDKDGTPEVIVNLLTGYVGWSIVLRYYEGNVYGYFFVARAMETPKLNGRYMASSSAFDNDILEMSFDGLKMIEKRIAHSVREDENNKYYIADKPVTEKEFNDLSAEFFLSEHVSWQLFSSDIRAGYKADMLLHVNFEAITRVVKEPASYYSTMENEGTYTNSSRIPEELCDILAEAMKAGGEEETIAAYTTEGTEISEEEFVSLTGVDMAFAGYAIPYKVDIDNDGTEDLISLVYGGGTGGFSSMELFKSVDGNYILTNSFECLLQEFHIISYQGKNYLLMNTFNYYTKYPSGFDLYLYENGTLADGVNFYYDITDYNMEIKYEDSSFAGIEQIKKTLTNKKMPEILERNDGVIYGTAEIIDNSGSDYYRYSADIDNDGNPEIYDKFMWYPSNMGTVMQCMYDFKDSLVFDDLWTRLSETVGEGRLYTFWLDKIENKNILYLYVGENMDFSLYAYLLERVR